MIEAALDFAASGLPVLPVGADKQPRIAQGFKSATTDADAIKRLDWSEGVAVAVPEGFVVIDCDPRNGGTETLKALRAAGRTLPPTKCVKTRSGGFHYWLRVPEGLSLRPSLGPGVDVKRASKGYVLVPPSPGYFWLNEHVDAAEAPTWLLDELRVEEREGPTGEANAPKFMERFEAGTAYGTAAMERELGRLAAAPEGERNHSLNRAAFSLAQLTAGGELDEGRARDELVRVAGRIGLDPHEIEATLDSGWRAGEQEPRQAPERETEPAALTPLTVSAGNSPSELWVDWEIDEPELPFYLRPILPKNAYVLVYGATEASKSMVWAALGAEASTRGHRVTVYSLENPAHVDRDRLRRMRPSRANFRLTNEPLDFNDARQLNDLVESEKAWGTDLLLIDTYSHAFNSRSEDGNAKAVEFARRVRHVMHEVGCSVVVVDHTGYQQKDEPRDASAKRQQVDVAIYMEKVGEWKPGVTVPRFRMVNKKAARFANPFDFTGEIRDVEIGDGAKGLELGWLHGKRPTWTDE